MTGEQLYKLYCEKALEVQNVGTDPWEEIGTFEQDTWNAVAAHLMEG